jgi:hypothetical protein
MQDLNLFAGVLGRVCRARRASAHPRGRQGRGRVLESTLLIATDVAARGLDMRVDLVVQTKPPVGRFSAKPEVRATTLTLTLTPQPQP